MTHRAMSATLAVEYQRLAVPGLPQDIAREVQPRLGEKARARHLVQIDDDLLTRLSENAAEIPDAPPEGIGAFN